VPLLRSICQQITLAHALPLDRIPTDTLPLINLFTALLQGTVGGTPHRPLVVFLDSLDMLSLADGAHLLAWFPALLATYQDQDRPRVVSNHLVTETKNRRQHHLHMQTNLSVYRNSYNVVRQRWVEDNCDMWGSKL